MRTRTMHRLFVLAAVVGGAAPVHAVVEEDRAILAGLTFPRPGAVGVRGDTLIFAYSVTTLTLEGPGGSQVPTTPDADVESRLGTLFLPSDRLSPGAWRVLGEPTPDTDNWAGDGVLVDLGTFEVGAVDRAPIVLTIDRAEWTDYDIGTDSLRVVLQTPGGAFEEPVILELDIGDADSPPDLEPDFATEWTQSAEVRPYSWEQENIDPQTATVRARAIDMSGTAGDWSDPASFEVELARLGDGGCHAAPGRSGAAGASALLILALGLAVGRGRRSRPRP